MVKIFYCSCCCDHLLFIVGSIPPPAPGIRILQGRKHFHFLCVHFLLNHFTRTLKKFLYMLKFALMHFYVKGKKVGVLKY
jgi:hypothetical protein